MITIDSYCQELKRIVKKFEHSDQISEIYFVLKSDKTVKHGEFVSYFRCSENDEVLLKNGVKNREDFIKQKGYYTGGKKEGVWVEFENKTDMDSGKYSDGKRIGIWNSYKGKDKVKSFDYDHNKKVGIWLTHKEGGLVVERYDYENNVQLEPEIRVNLSYPVIAKENGIQGMVRIRFHIDPDCTIENITVIQSLSPECDRAAIEAMQEYAELHRKYCSNCIDRIAEKEFLFRLD
jgi:TonB family protein